jgi:hypothetical protein
MPEYLTGGLQGPDLRGLTAPSRPVVKTSRDIEAQLLGDVVKAGLGIYGSKKAKEAGAKLAGEGETHVEAGMAAESAGAELEGLISQEKQATGKPVSMDQVTDLKEQVFGKVLNNHKRIQSALDRGLISSTEANARIAVLRNEALSNPLVAPFQDQLDNALYRNTGGSGTTFAATAAEIEAAAVRKGQLAAQQKLEGDVTRMVQTGQASSRQQALSLIAQGEQHARTMQYYEEKRAALTITSAEAYASSQILATSQAASAYGVIAEWSKAGGDAKQVQALQAKFINEGEQIKNAIRKASFDKNGVLLVGEDTLRSQLEEVDKRVAGFSDMLKDQSGTKAMMDIMAQRQAALEYKGQDLQIELAKRAPFLFALKDFPRASEWYWDNAVNFSQESTKWDLKSNPMLQLINDMTPEQVNEAAVSASENLLEGKLPSKIEKETLALTLAKKGGVDAVDKALQSSPETTIRTLRETPFRLKDINNSTEWVNKAKTPEGKDAVLSIVEGAANRALVSSIAEPFETSEEINRGMGNKRNPKVLDFTIPSEVIVRKNVQGATTGGGRGQGNVIGSKVPTWTVDTKGIAVSDIYRKEIIHAYELGTKAPQLWQDDYESVDQWINALFARPKK